MRVYIILFCFWDGDSWLRNEFVDIAKNWPEVCKIVELFNDDKLRVYAPNEEPPEQEDGHYGSPSFYQIINRNI